MENRQDSISLRPNDVQSTLWILTINISKCVILKKKTFYKIMLAMNFMPFLMNFTYIEPLQKIPRLIVQAIQKNERRRNDRCVWVSSKTAQLTQNVPNAKQKVSLKFSCKIFTIHLINKNL